VVFSGVVEFHDCTIFCGHRGEAAQNAAFEDESSGKRWPDSRHNAYPSLAVDAGPWPIGDRYWDDRERFTLFAGIVIGYARAKGILLRWGGNWDRDTEVADNTFDDLVHFEIVG
jgi:hypothetical protein